MPVAELHVDAASQATIWAAREAGSVRNARAGTYPLTVTVASNGYDGVTASERSRSTSVRQAVVGRRTRDRRGAGSGSRERTALDRGSRPAEPGVVAAAAARTTDGPVVPAVVLLVLAGSLLAARSLRARLAS